MVEDCHRVGDTTESNFKRSETDINIRGINSRSSNQCPIIGDDLRNYHSTNTAIQHHVVLLLLMKKPALW
ncbi:MAG: hypothetical protein ABI970_12325, partial [Chloroflexota bacterium]